MAVNAHGSPGEEGSVVLGTSGGQRRATFKGRKNGLNVRQWRPNSQSTKTDATKLIHEILEQR